MPSLKVVTLNVGRGFSHGSMQTVYGFLSQPRWDVACLQDVCETHLDELTRLFPAAQVFAPMTKHPIGKVRVPVGIGIFSKWPFKSKSVYAYVGHTDPVPNLDGVEVNEFGNARPKDLKRVRETESRLAVFVEVEVLGAWFKIGTTHGPWVPEGVPDDHQREAMKGLGTIMGNQGSCVMAGDFNTPRDAEAYEIFLARSMGTDCVPRTITNSVDWKMRGKEGPDVLVDYFFTRESYYVQDVQIHFGISDHAALSATVSKKM